MSDSPGASGLEECSFEGRGVYRLTGAPLPTGQVLLYVVEEDPDGGPFVAGFHACQPSDLESTAAELKQRLNDGKYRASVA